MAGCSFSRKLAGQLITNLSKKDKAVVSDAKYSGNRHRETFASSKPISERMTCKTQTPVNTFLSITIFIGKKLKGWSTAE